MDHNEHTYDGPLGRALSDPEGVGLQEAVLRHTQARGEAPPSSKEVSQSTDCG
jgi:hypothetical protein